MKKILYIAVLVICIGIYIRIFFFYIPSHAESIFEQKRESLEIDIKKQVKEAWGGDDALLFFKDMVGQNTFVWIWMLYALLTKDKIPICHLTS